ncbi:MAG: transcriptional repressor [Marinobacter sp.]|nr:transcriptional repressor [Marinobacter sp.]
MEWQTILHEKNLRATRTTLAILEILQQARGPVSQTVLTEQLRASSSDHSTDRVTIYRTLERLQNADMVLCTTSSGQSRCYVLKAFASAGQFECQRCKKVSLLHTDTRMDSAIRRLHQQLAAQGIKVSENGLSLRGLCQTCNTAQD